MFVYPKPIIANVLQLWAMLTVKDLSKLLPLEAIVALEQVEADQLSVHVLHCKATNITGYHARVHGSRIY